jgi:hypothetical protein
LRIVSESIDEFLSGPRVRVLAVQLDSPFGGDQPEMRYYPQFKQFQWHDRQRSIATRTAKIMTLVDRLDSFAQPNFIVFPEYTVPQESHDVLRQCAVRRQCIVVAGSYYETDPSRPLFRRNVGTIFLPDGRDVIIVKKEPFGDEHLALAPPGDYPNIARLLWRHPDGIKSFAVNVFLCRDYLMPYRRGEHGEHVSCLDWATPGLNLVVMCSASLRLFKGAAAFDIREMRGEGKFVALCNSSQAAGGTAESEGSALLGPAGDAAQETDDVIVQLSGAQEGLLEAQMDLSTVALIDCVGHECRWSVDAGEFEISQRQARPVRRRGVWHPALLEVINRNIVFKLLTAYDFVGAKTTFRQGPVSWLTVATIRGEHDFLVSFYAEPGKEDASIGMPYWALGESAFASLFDTKRQVTLVIRPRNIHKFRDVKIAPYDSEEWRLRRDQIEELLPNNPAELKLYLSQLCKLARNWDTLDVPEAIRQKVAGCFTGTLETTPVIDLDSGHGDRQTFVLVTILSKRKEDFERFRSVVVRGWLCDVTEIRSVFQLQMELQEPEVHWEYWLDMIAPPPRTDRIVEELFERSTAVGIRIGTRSMDRSEYLTLESVEGVEWVQRYSEVVAFMQHRLVRRIWQVHGSDCDPVRMQSYGVVASNIASAYFEQLSKFDPELPDVERTAIVGFYVLWFCANFSKLETHRNERMMAAADAWRRIYQAVEHIAEHGVRRRLGDHYTKAFSDYFRRIGKAERIPAVKDNVIKGLFEYLASLQSGRAEQEEHFTLLRREFDQLVYPVRNHMSHGYGYKEQLDVIGVDATEAAHRADNVSRVSRALEFLMNALTAFKRLE